MLGPAGWSARRKAVLAAALALLLAVPLGISEQTQPVVTGHSTFYNGLAFDPCLASIAGIIRTQVMWFNDQVLAERYGGKGTFVYVTENGSADPRARNSLYTEGVFYDFVDPNGVHWHVDEAFMGPIDPNGADPGAITPDDPGAGQPDGALDESKRTYVWVVELSAFPIHDQFAGSPDSPDYHDLYNFLVIVDTCRFHRNVQTNFNGARHNADPADTYDFNVTHNGTVLNPGYGHETGTGNHTHESFMADIWIGQRPVLVPVGADSTGAQWEADWAVSGPQGKASDAYPGKPDPLTGDT